MAKRDYEGIFESATWLLFAAGFFVIFAVAVASAYGWLGGAP